MVSAEGIFMGRAPRNTEAQVDVIVVCYRPNIAQVPWCVEGFHECTDVPWNLTVVLDGVAPEDVVPVRVHCEGLSCQSFRIVAISQPKHFGVALHAGVTQRYGAPIIVISQPNVRVVDPQWFGKVQQVFLQDAAAAAVLFGDVAPNVSNVPMRAPMVMDVDGERQVIAVDPRILGAIDLSKAIDPGWQKQVASWMYDSGCFAWTVPTVRTMTLPGRTIHAPRHDGPPVEKVGHAARAGAGRDS